MPAADVNGAQLYYEAIGEGRPCLVMSGWPGVDHTYLRPGLDRLAATGTLQLVYYDHRGNGRSRHQAPLDELTLEQLADDAAALAAVVSDAPVLVLGHAHGASVAQELAIRHPDRVAGLILIAATPGELGMEENLADTLDDTPVPVEVEVLQRVPPATDEEWAATMRGVAPYFFARPDAADPEAVFGGTTCNADAARRWMQSLSFWSASDRLVTVAVPALVLVGAHDRIFGPAQARRVARRMPNAELVVLEECGHLPWLDGPDTLVAAVDGWLAERT